MQQRQKENIGQQEKNDRRINQTENKQNKALMWTCRGNSFLLLKQLKLFSRVISADLFLMHLFRTWVQEENYL